MDEQEGIARVQLCVTGGWLLCKQEEEYAESEGI